MALHYVPKQFLLMHLIAPYPVVAFVARSFLLLSDSSSSLCDQELNLPTTRNRS
ncbi:hypothetical protein BDV40DRAFT_256976 [Aspergillus tamarii]|uniref:Uncharacterized protein n=1 Tax=Aspergillus tamarii TaxID=41984 RepID=A0A5N6V4D6_ASPTM|nr:hypothetical protein BDV40DRAFT_256976 [Aspergillus tamarii]